MLLRLDGPEEIAFSIPRALYDSADLCEEQGECCARRGELQLVL